MNDGTAHDHACDPAGDNRAELAEHQAKAAEERFDALLAALPFGNAAFKSGDITAAWQDDDLNDEEPPFVAPQAVSQITLKRIDGTRAEIDRFKKGYRTHTWADADAALREWAGTVPEGTTQRIAYVVEVSDGTRLYGTFPLTQQGAPFRSWVITENELDPAYLKAT